MENNKRKSKYLRDPNEVKKSKYLRDKDEKKSKYLKDNNSVHHYRLAKDYREEEELETQEPEEELEVEAQPEEPEELISETEYNNEEEDLAKEAEIQLIDEPKSDEEEKAKGDISSIFKSSSKSKATTVAKTQTAEEGRQKTIIKTVVVMVLLTVIACALQFAVFKLPFLPDMLNIELSAFPELIASLAYGPVFGVIIVIIKNVFHVFTVNNGFASELSNLVLDSIYVFTAGLIYSRRMFSINPKNSKKPSKKDKRRSRILLGGFIGTVLTTVTSFFLTRFVSYPLLLRQYKYLGVNEYYIINIYQQALDKLNSELPERISSVVTTIENLSQAILFYNIPFTFFKFLVITLVSALIYIIISPYIHFRKKAK